MATLKINRNTNWQPLPAPALSTRAVCPKCKKPRAIKYNYTIKEAKSILVKGMQSEDRQSPRKWRYLGYGYFCSLRCGTAYANKIVEEKANK